MRSLLTSRRPTLVAGLLDEEVPQGNRQPCPCFAASFKIGIEEGQRGVLTGAIHEDDFGRWFISQALVHLPHGEVAAAKQHREAVFLGPAIDGLGTGSDHSLRISKNDELLALEGIQLIDDPLL